MNLVDKTSEMARATVVLDWDEQCVIFLLTDSPGEYIVASNDPNDTPEDILEHFADYIRYYEKKDGSASDS